MMLKTAFALTLLAAVTQAQEEGEPLYGIKNALTETTLTVVPS